VKLLAFLKRDLLVSLSYRFRLILGAGSMVVYLFVFYFVGRTFDGALAPYLASYGGQYFPYVLVGVAVSSFVSVGLGSLGSQIRAAQLQGTLESLLCTPTSITTVLLGNSLSGFVSAFATGSLTLFGGAAVLGLAISPLQAFAALLVLLLTFAAFLSVGMLSASFVMVFKEGDPISLLFGTSSYFVGGVFFPVGVLPKPLRGFAEILPITPAIEALRRLLLSGAGLDEVVPLVLRLLLFIGLVGPVSLFVFHRSVARAKRNGSLVQF
jgi:ABC-2 type transport system permease protein